MLQGVDFHWFPLSNPGLVSIPLSFLLGVHRHVARRAAAERRAPVRRDGGPGADRRGRGAGDGAGSGDGRRADALRAGSGSAARWLYCGRTAAKPPCCDRNPAPAHRDGTPPRGRIAAMNGVPDGRGGRPARRRRRCSTSASPTSGPPGHAPTARHLPMSELIERLDEVPDDDPLYVVCRSGGRSARVVAYLASRATRRSTSTAACRRGPPPGRAVVADTAARRRSSSRPCAVPPRRAAVPPLRARVRRRRGPRSARTAGATSPRCSGWPSRPRRPSPPLPVPQPTRYVGPPRYRSAPRSGASRRRRGRSADTAAPSVPAGADRPLAAPPSLVPLLWATAAVALLAARRRGVALRAAAGQPGRRAVGGRGGRVGRAGGSPRDWVASCSASPAGCCWSRWTLRAAAAAAARAGCGPSRSCARRSCSAGWCPG